ncbi:PREDICTED: protein SPEAR3-like [Lupinus angustifolius]|uniref:protein SPEAR3-like n=1 Tax=Lupinus angustifolius TaxID=3871 RepID=UPI00092FD8FE|nr:PREDICTED: protein SPEAR3-like [Lupinus angustifolius]
MDSNYFGELNMGNERGNGSSNSSRKGKKNNQDKPKQPQRGLGVAQLEKIRIHGQIASGYHPPQHGSYPSTFNNEDPIVKAPYHYSSILPSPSPSPSSSISFSSSSAPYSASYGFQSNYVMRLSEYERTNTRYHDSQPTRTRWEHAILKTHSSAQPITGSLLNLYDSQQHIETKKHRSDSVGSSSQNYESSDPQEPDLELRLSL